MLHQRSTIHSQTKLNELKQRLQRSKTITEEDDLLFLTQLFTPKQLTPLFEELKALRIKIHDATTVNAIASGDPTEALIADLEFHKDFIFTRKTTVESAVKTIMQKYLVVKIKGAIVKLNDPFVLLKKMHSNLQQEQNVYQGKRAALNQELSLLLRLSIANLTKQKRGLLVNTAKKFALEQRIKTLRQLDGILFEEAPDVQRLIETLHTHLITDKSVLDKYDRSRIWYIINTLMADYAIYLKEDNYQATCQVINQANLKSLMEPLSQLQKKSLAASIKQYIKELENILNRTYQTNQELLALLAGYQKKLYEIQDKLNQDTSLKKKEKLVFNEFLNKQQNKIVRIVLNPKPETAQFYFPAPGPDSATNPLKQMALRYIKQKTIKELANYKAERNQSWKYKLDFRTNATPGGHGTTKTDRFNAVTIVEHSVEYIENNKNVENIEKDKRPLPSFIATLSAKIDDIISHAKWLEVVGGNLRSKLLKRFTAIRSESVAVIASLNQRFKLFENDIHAIKIQTNLSFNQKLIKRLTNYQDKKKAFLKFVPGFISKLSSKVAYAGEKNAAEIKLIQDYLSGSTTADYILAIEHINLFFNRKLIDVNSELGLILKQIQHDIIDRIVLGNTTDGRNQAYATNAYQLTFSADQLANIKFYCLDPVQAEQVKQLYLQADKAIDNNMNTDFERPTSKQPPLNDIQNQTLTNKLEKNKQDPLIAEYTNLITRLTHQHQNQHYAHDDLRRYVILRQYVDVQNNVIAKAIYNKMFGKLKDLILAGKVARAGVFTLKPNANAEKLATAKSAIAGITKKAGELVPGVGVVGAALGMVTDKISEHSMQQHEQDLQTYANYSSNLAKIDEDAMVLALKIARQHIHAPHLQFAADAPEKIADAIYARFIEIRKTHSDVQDIDEIIGRIYLMDKKHGLLGLRQQEIQAPSTKEKFYTEDYLNRGALFCIDKDGNYHYFISTNAQTTFKKYGFRKVHPLETINIPHYFSDDPNLNEVKAILQKIEAKENDFYQIQGQEVIDLSAPIKEMFENEEIFNKAGVYDITPNNEIIWYVPPYQPQEQALMNIEKYGFRPMVNSEKIAYSNKLNQNQWVTVEAFIKYVTKNPTREAELKKNIGHKQNEIKAQLNITTPPVAPTSDADACRSPIARLNISQSIH